MPKGPGSTLLSFACYAVQKDNRFDPYRGVIAYTSLVAATNKGRLFGRYVGGSINQRGFHDCPAKFTPDISIPYFLFFQSIPLLPQKDIKKTRYGGCFVANVLFAFDQFLTDGLISLGDPRNVYSCWKRREIQLELAFGGVKHGQSLCLTFLFTQYSSAPLLYHKLIARYIFLL